MLTLLLCVLNLHGLQRFKRILPLDGFESNIIAFRVELSIDVDKELCGEHNEAGLVP